MLTVSWAVWLKGISASFKIRGFGTFHPGIPVLGFCFLGGSLCHDNSFFCFFLLTFTPFSFLSFDLFSS